ncbi:MAG: hypothetical protein ABSA92_05970 [Candidatus Bathyarchaeia archaeon]
MSESKSDPPEMRIQIVTAKGYRNEIDLLSDEVLRPFGKTKKDVWSVRWSDHFSDSVYTELDLASPRHPLIGSGSATMCFRGGEVGEMSDIFYQDYNDAHNHFAGKPHWNHERRYKMDGQNHTMRSIPREHTLLIGHLGFRYLRLALMEPFFSRRCLGFQKSEHSCALVNRPFAFEDEQVI